ncbi:hypothetical protein [Bacillus sp. AK128]
MNRMLEELSDLYMVDLIYDENLQGNYERFNLKKATGMVHRNYNQQKGKIK